MDLTAIAGAYQGIRNIKEIVSGFIDSKADAAAKEKVFDVKERLGAIQDTLFELRDTLAALQDENARLRAQVAAGEAWQQRAAEYKLVETTGGAIVYQYSGEPAHYACPNCFEGKKVSILQSNRSYKGSYSCKACDASYLLEPLKPIAPPRLY
ncbi:hypothetical protein [Caballeronia sp. LZ043]|uniref:hypothetical protein n=1 Tax=Caballeronia sp. LZ043 TaxID=3038569 RepID=UPI0028672261|nr:hypothetical protein [Caballeronia sp. LZ043]MDR5819848.1 hypothetical protein [Caballeronia sp. LZ043]